MEHLNETKDTRRFLSAAILLLYILNKNNYPNNNCITSRICMTTLNWGTLLQRNIHSSCTDGWRHMKGKVERERKMFEAHLWAVRKQSKHQPLFLGHTFAVNAGTKPNTMLCNQHLHLLDNYRITYSSFINLQRLWGAQPERTKCTWILSCRSWLTGRNPVVNFFPK